MPSLLTPTPIREAPAVDQIEVEVVSPYVEVQARWHGKGAGTVIKLDDEVLVLTAGHVVEGFDTIEGEEAYHDAKGEKHATKIKSIRVPDILKKVGDTEDRRAAEVVWYTDSEEKGGNDLALLKPTNAEGLRAARLHLKDDLQWGEATWYIGTPEGVHSRLEQSIVSLRHWRMFNRLWTGTNGCGWRGNSGGGLYVIRDGHYVLAGVVTRRMFGENPNGPIYAKLPTDVEKFLDSYRKHRGK